MPKQAAATLEKWEKEQLQAGFELLDLNKDGRIVLDELSAALAACGFEYSEQDVADMIRVVDSNRNADASITLPQFLRLFPHQNMEESQEDIEDAFNHISKGEGDLTKEDLMNIFQSIQIDCTEEEIDELIQMADFDEDGYIGLEDFRAMCNSKDPREDQ